VKIGAKNYFNSVGGREKNYFNSVCRREKKNYEDCLNSVANDYLNKDFTKIGAALGPAPHLSLWKMSEGGRLEIARPDSNGFTA
jgi:hypothetical protein